MSRPDPAGDGETPVASRDGRTDPQCDKLIAHTVSLAVAERPADQKLSDEEREAIRSQVRTKWLPGCKQMSAASYDCALASHSLGELEGC